ncbi:protein telomere ends associated isoform X2 [Drosophila eugracilis]|uniref:protein telomere ends associated isoform X2 n=1 Tax=Drosophila eugracilis TaxID=29029 RepID=UPI0007E6B514|nr:protein telomere ends associated isoform X2 [Drosophila eugracilis]
MLAISNVEVQDDQIKGDSSQVLHPESHDVIVKVDKSGTFVFPVSFKIFEKYLNKAVLFDQIAKSREKCMELLVDDNYRLLTLRKFYNLFYMFPETESRAHFFKDLPGIPLSTLVKLGQPQDEKAYNTVAEYAAKKSLEDNSIVSFKVFQKNILNLSDIVEEMKQLDNNYLSKDFRECALDYYLAFYITPEIREMYAYKLRSNTNAMKTRLLAILNEEVADELRKNLRQLANPSPALKLRRSKTPEKSTGEDKSAGDNQLKSKTSEESVKVPAIPSIEIADEIGQIMPQLPISSPGLKLRKPKTPKKTATEDKSVKDNHLKSLSTEESLQVPTIPSIPMADEIGQMLPQLPIFSPGRRLRRSKTPEKTGAEDKSVAYEIGQILPQLSTPQPALRLRRSKTPERSEHQSESGKENKMKTIESLPFETDVQINIGKRGRFIFPVSFKTFRSYINYKDIIRPILMKELTQNEAELADLIADPSNPQCKKVFLQYYYKFYARHDVRQRYAYKFNCPDPKMLAKILEPAKPLDEKAMQTVSRTTAPQVEGKSPNKTKDQVASTLEKPAKESPSNPISFEIFKSRVTVTVTDTTYMDNKTVDNAKESELIPECENKVTGKTEICTNKKPREKSGLNPITFEMFKRRVSNMDEIVNKMLLCDEYKGKSKEMVFYDYYEGFYSGPEMREKFECRFKPCPSKKLQILLSFPPNNEKECRKETDCQVCTSNELCEVGQQELAIPRSIEKNTEDVAKESEQITEHQAKVTTEPGAFQNQSHTEPQAMPNAASSKAATVPDLESQGPIERSELQNKQTVAKSASISDICNAERIAELARKRKIDVGKYEPHNFYQYLFAGSTCPKKQDYLKQKYKIYCSAQEKNLKENEPVSTSSVEKVSSDPAIPVTTQEDKVLETVSNENSSRLSEVKENSSIISNITIKNAVQASTKNVEADSSNNPRSSPRPKSPSESSEGATSSTQSSDTQILLEKAKAIFFAETEPHHKLKYLLYTSQGLMGSLWRILNQLTLDEFAKYTNIHDGGDLYLSDEDLQLCFQHVVTYGNWPVNLCIQLPYLKRLFHKKEGVYLNKLELAQLSPKIVDAWELSCYSDFDKIVEQHYTNRTGKKIEDVVHLCQEREKLYASCWTHNQWIPLAPQITDETLNAELEEVMPILDEITLKPISDISGEVGNVLTETVLISSSADSGSESSQLEKTNFVDVMGVAQASQVPQMAWDPLISEDPGDLLPVVKSTELVSVKRESIALPTNLRVICESDDCQWEDITPEDQIIDLDASQNEGSTLSCFDIPNSKNQDSEEMVELLLSNTNLSEDDGPVGNVIELEASAAKELVINAPTPAFNIPVNPTKRRAPSPGLKCKRYKLMNDKVPQLRHEFQSLPMGVMVRLESGQENNTDSPNTMAIQPVKPTNMPTPEPAETHITPSQDFAVGNELLDCTELKGLLDSTNVNTRKRFPSTAQNYLLRA